MKFEVYEEKLAESGKVRLVSVVSETAKHIPIIALTANAYHEDIQKCLAAGMNAHLSKPINIDRAMRTIIECDRTAKENG